MVFKFGDDLTIKENMPRFSEIASLRRTALGSFHYKKFFWSIRAEKCSFRTLAYFTQKPKTKVQRTRLWKIRFYISSIHDLNENFIKLFNCSLYLSWLYLCLFIFGRQIWQYFAKWSQAWRDFEASGHEYLLLCYENWKNGYKNKR